MRIEDTDRARSESRFEGLICGNLKWLGLDWQEGPDCGGPFGPYRQSSRTTLYARHAERLLGKGFAYRCFCSEEELGRQAREARRGGVTWKYPGTCRNLSPREVAQRLAASHPSVIRLRVRSGRVVFRDLVHGEMAFDSEVLGDPILIRVQWNAHLQLRCGRGRWLDEDQPRHSGRRPPLQHASTGTDLRGLGMAPAGLRSFVHHSWPRPRPSFEATWGDLSSTLSRSGSSFRGLAQLFDPFGMGARGRPE